MVEFQEKCRLLSREQICDGIQRLTLHAPQIAKRALPGQFVMLRVSDRLDPLLRRPFSIHHCSEDGALGLLFKTVGRGTKVLSEIPLQRELDLIGPLGRGFDGKGNGPVCLIGGGMGIAPLLFLAQQLLEADRRPDAVHVLLGARNRCELAVLAEEFSRLGCPVQVATDDGSMGLQGFVPQLLDAVLPQVERVYSCGPWPMMKSIAAKCIQADVQCQVSLEAHMACGLGACLGCTRTGADGAYLHVCRQGPVFAAEEVAW